MSKYKCEECEDTGWAGDTHAGFGGWNQENAPCDCRAKGVMKQEDLKILAEWYGYKKNEIVKVEDYGIGIKDCFPFRPHEDSNQLDMLEDKMIEGIQNKYEQRICIKIINNYGKKEFIYIITLYPEDSESSDRHILVSIGKTKNEARLSAILNYVKE